MTVDSIPSITKEYYMGGPGCGELIKWMNQIKLSELYPSKAIRGFD
jgi:hypothetical protein